MPFDPKSVDLPIVEILDEVKSHLQQDNTLIVHAPPGAGKSTLLPIALFEEAWLKGQKIIMLEPRRLAARSIAMRLSELLGEQVGETIGYRIRFETRVSDATRIEVVTEGILTRMLHGDNTLEGVGLVIFDEFHERSIHADVALALCRESQQILRPDLKIMVMSATLNMPQLTQSLKASVVESKGRQYPVDIEYVGDQDQFMIPEMTANTVVKASKMHEGDILVFMPGQGEITKCAGILKSKLKGFQIHPLYGQLPYNKQKAAILPDKEGRRKVVLATNIAETSLTIEGIKVVVDTGFGRTMKWDPKSGLSRLETVQISKDSADQRAGRAGRLSPGVCYRMWSKTTDSRLQEHRTPEILESDLASLALDLASWGISDPLSLTWLSPPPRGAWQAAVQTLHELEALENGRITPHGKEIHRLPCHPRLAHMMLMAEEEGLVSLAADVAALLEERDPLGKEAGIDINNRIEVLRTHRRENRKGGRFDRIEKIAASYRQLFKEEVDNDPFDPYETGLLLTHAFPERIAFARPGNNAQFKLANGRIAMAGHKDDLAHESWLAIANLDARDGMGKIFMASPLNPKDLASRVKEVEVVEWDTEDGGLNASKDLRIGNIVLKSVPLPDSEPSHLKDAIVQAIKKEGRTLLDWNEEVEQLQNRIKSLRRWESSHDWPDFSTDTLLMTNDEWLSPYLTEVKNPRDLKKINLYDVLLHSLDYEKQQELNKLVPAKMEVPSGSSIKIMYRDNGESPVLAARIQELFGMEETPSVNNGKQALLIHLLSPGFKPVQVTSDLKNFWNETYFEVRKDLKGRYPKHHWPDDPWTAEAIRGVKPRGGSK
ncbi:ATP-dependent helicase HrpB [Ekhidna sp.]|uniref:ATP-dependent helicase HrpB n=1 Tax=Ekhidna sp. TaxID=2608089 RepID=UPI003BA93338